MTEKNVNYHTFHWTRRPVRCVYFLVQAHSVLPGVPASEGHGLPAAGDRGAGQAGGGAPGAAGRAGGGGAGAAGRAAGWHCALSACWPANQVGGHRWGGTNGRLPGLL